MRIARGEELHEFFGELTPRELHLLYMAGCRVIAQGELYPGECADLYRANGYSQVSVSTPFQFDAGEFLHRHSALEAVGAVVGPFVMADVVQNDAMSLWRPHPMPFDRMEWNMDAVSTVNRR